MRTNRNGHASRVTFRPCIAEPNREAGGRWSVLRPCLCTCLGGHHDYDIGVLTMNLFTRIRGRKTAVIVNAIGSRKICGSIPVTGPEYSPQ